MILAPTGDRHLRLVIRRAARPDEDVFHRWEDVYEAMYGGDPRLLICRVEEQGRLRRQGALFVEDLPFLAVAESTLKLWECAWMADGLAIERVDDSALRLRRIIEKTARGPDWVDAIFADLTRAVGRPLPSDLKGFARRVLEFPARYSSSSTLAGAFGLSPGALKARFRRRGIPSPSRHLRWFRLLAAQRVLSVSGATIFSASLRLGFASDGNFCRWVQGTSGLAPSDLRTGSGRLLLLFKMAEDCLSARGLEGWETFGGLFLSKVA